MYEITGIEKATLRTVDVAVATCPAELHRVLAEEQGNYIALNVKRVRTR